MQRLARQFLARRVMRLAVLVREVYWRQSDVEQVERYHQHVACAAIQARIRGFLTRVHVVPDRQLEVGVPVAVFLGAMQGSGALEWVLLRKGLGTAL